MAHRIRNFSSRGSMSRKTQWTASIANTQFQALAAATSLLDSTFVTTLPETIVRIRGLLTVMTDQAAASEQPFGALGFAIVSDEAAAAGIGSMPTPYTDANSDLFMVHQYWSAPMLVGTSVGFGGAGTQRYEIDSKAMRKVHEDTTLAIIMENGNATDGILYSLDFRILTKLP